MWQKASQWSIWICSAAEMPRANIQIYTPNNRKYLESKCDLTVSLVAFHWKLWSLKSNIHQSFYPNITLSQYIDVEIWKYTCWLMTLYTYCRLLLLINQFQWAALHWSKACISYFHTHTMTKGDFHVFNLFWTCCNIQYGTKRVGHHRPDSCSVTAEASDEADTHVVSRSHAHSNGFIKLPRC